MSLLKLAAAALFVVAVPVFLVATNVRWVVNAPFVYNRGFDKYDIPARTGIERSELLSAVRQIRSYFSNDVLDLDVRVAIGGVTYSIYNVREVAHMRDVKSLVRGLYRVQELTGAYLLAFAAVGLWTGRRRFLPRLGRYIGFGGGLTLGLIALVGLASLVEFDRLFLAFHLVSFSNDLWQLDPARDYLIAMFPQSFFFDATMWVAVSTIAEALLLTLGPLVLVWWLPKRAERSALSAPILDAVG